MLRTLDEGVVQAPQNIDLTMIIGAELPFWNGDVATAELHGYSREGYWQALSFRRNDVPGTK